MCIPCYSFCGPYGSCCGPSCGFYCGGCGPCCGGCGPCYGGCGPCCAFQILPISVKNSNKNSQKSSPCATRAAAVLATRISSYPVALFSLRKRNEATVNIPTSNYFREESKCATRPTVPSLPVDSLAPQQQGPQPPQQGPQPPQGPQQGPQGPQQDPQGPQQDPQGPQQDPQGPQGPQHE
ncbi:hypothetical protein ACLKA6_011948 [Drosophila palustris]